MPKIVQFFHPGGETPKEFIKKKSSKRTFKLSLFGFSPIVLFLASCGDDVTNVTNEAGMEIIASADSLGKCTEERSGEMKFVSKENAVYVCSDTSWKNVSAAEKASCTVKNLTDSSGYKIVCGGDSVGVVFNGKKGDDGKTGTSCTVVSSPLLESDGGYFVICGSDTVGTLANGRDGESCSFIDNGDGSVMQNCGGKTVTLYKAFCGESFFDPDSNFCFGDTVITLCGGKTYNLSERFCFDDSLYEFCDGKRFDPETEFCDARDEQLYKFTAIGDQIWMTENLNYAYMPDTLSFCYNNDSANCEKFGRLYTWSAAVDSAAKFSDNGKGCGDGKNCSPTYPVRGSCPTGWHLPDTTEWSKLETFVANSLFDGKTDSVGYALKSTSDWINDGYGSDAFGFEALPAGYCRSHTFYNVLDYANFWSATEYSEIIAYFRGLIFNRTDLRTSSVNLLTGDTKDLALSVRCVKDD